jgi:hypothetical protein
MRRILITALCGGLFGCVSSHVSSHLAAGSIGCLSDDIKITREDYTLATDSNEFIAECGGKKFACTYVNARYNETQAPAVCHPLIAQAETEKNAAEDCASRKRYNDTLVCPPKN